MQDATFPDRVRAEAPAVARFVQGLLGEDAPDVVQEALAVALSRPEAFDGRAKLSTWLYGVARNLCYAELRRRVKARAREGTSALDDRRAAGRGVVSSVVRREQSARLEDSLSRLPDALREAFVLRYVEGLDYGEIATIVQATAGTARVRAFRARALLRNELGPVVDTAWGEPGGR